MQLRLLFQLLLNRVHRIVETVVRMAIGLIGLAAHCLCHLFVMRLFASPLRRRLLESKSWRGGQKEWTGAGDERSENENQHLIKQNENLQSQIYRVMSIINEKATNARVNTWR